MEITAREQERRSALLLGLSADDIADRRNSIGASDANIILGGDPAAVVTLWHVKRGELAAENLDDVLAVQMGVWTEDLNLRWFEKQTGQKVTDRRAKLKHPDHDFITATLDGKTTLPPSINLSGDAAVIDAKHVGPFGYDIDATVRKYMPQMAVQMSVAETPWAILSVFSGNSKWEFKAIERDPLYEVRVLAELRKFWACVQSGTPPVDILEVSPALPAALMRSVDMTRHNAWCALERDYTVNAKAAATYEEAKTGLKALVEPDVREAKGNLLTIKRSKSGSLTFSQTKK